MQRFIVLRRGIASTAAELDAALTRLREFEEKADAPNAQWIRSYALREPAGRFGLACVLEADDAQTLEWHAALTGVDANEILPIAATVFVRPFAPKMVYLIRRRNFWTTAAELERSAAISRRVGAQMSDEVSWLQTYAVRENDGTLGTVCIYQGVDAGALRRHAARAGMPADEIVPIFGRIVFREDAADPLTSPIAAAA